MPDFQGPDYEDAYLLAGGGGQLSIISTCVDFLVLVFVVIIILTGHWPGGVIV